MNQKTVRELRERLAEIKVQLLKFHTVKKTKGIITPVDLLPSSNHCTQFFT